MAHVNISMFRTKGMIEKVNNVSLSATVNVNIGNRASLPCSIGGKATEKQVMVTIHRHQAHEPNSELIESRLQTLFDFQDFLTRTRDKNIERRIYKLIPNPPVSVSPHLSLNMTYAPRVPSIQLKPLAATTASSMPVQSTGWKPCRTKSKRFTPPPLPPVAAAPVASPVAASS